MAVPGCRFADFRDHQGCAGFPLALRRAPHHPRARMSADHELADRIRGALWGTFVGDALCLGSHWIYNLGEMAQRFGPAGPQGFDEPAEGHYHYPKRSGELTHYGEGALVLLESMAAHGRLDLAGLLGALPRAIRFARIHRLPRPRHEGHAGELRPLGGGQSRRSVSLSRPAPMTTSSPPPRAWRRSSSSIATIPPSST